VEGLSVDIDQLPGDRTLDLRLDVRAETLRFDGRDYQAARIGVAAQSNGKTLSLLGAVAQGLR
jgi:hypothetical protein